MDVDAYLAVRNRIVSVVEGHGEESVPACPEWTVRDVVAHLAGLCEDWVDHRLSGYGSDEWTAAQIARFDGLSVRDIVARWHDVISSFVQLDDDPVMGPPARWAFGDAVTHEADLRGAVAGGRVPDDAVLLALKGAIARWRGVLHDAAMPTLLLRAVDARDWLLGEPSDSDAVMVETSAYEVFRALAGRRSAEQVRSWRWSRDPSPYIAAGLPYPFQWSGQDLID